MNGEATLYFATILIGMLSFLAGIFLIHVPSGFIALGICMITVGGYNVWSKIKKEEKEAKKHGKTHKNKPGRTEDDISL